MRILLHLMKTMSLRSMALFVCVLAGGWPCGALCAQERGGVNRFIRWSYQDVGTLLGQAERRDWVYTAGFLGALGVLSAQDQAVVDWVQDGYRGAWGQFLDRANALGGPPVLPISAGIFGVNAPDQEPKITRCSLYLFRVGRLYRVDYRELEESIGPSPSRAGLRPVRI